MADNLIVLKGDMKPDLMGLWFADYYILMTVKWVDLMTLQITNLGASQKILQVVER